jgi:hypothetical protein
MITNINGKIQAEGLEAGIAFGLISTAEIRDCEDLFSPKETLNEQDWETIFGQQQTPNPRRINLDQHPHKAGECRLRLSIIVRQLSI